MIVNLLLFQLSASLALPNGKENCNSPLGMESGLILDDALTASSAHDPRTTGAQNARIRTSNGGGAWCPKKMIGPESLEWFQIDLGKPFRISGIETQGRDTNGGIEYTPKMIVEYWRPELNRWWRYRESDGNEILLANTDPSTAVRQDFYSPFVATRVRILPYADAERVACLRVELYGCLYKSELMSYDAPNGSEMTNLDLQDTAYDGSTDNGYWWTGGLGELHDGLVGSDDYWKTGRWVGWDQVASGPSIDFTLALSTVRNVSSIFIHTHNFLRKDVEVFRTAKISFSLDDILYTANPFVFTHEADLDSEKSRWVAIDLPRRVARYIKIELEFASRWILISEIAIESMPIRNNVSNPPVSIPVDSITVVALDEAPLRFTAIAVGLSLAVAILAASIVLAYVVRQRSKMVLGYNAVYPPSTTTTVLDRTMKVQIGRHDTPFSHCSTLPATDCFYNFSQAVTTDSLLPTTPPPKCVPVKCLPLQHSPTSQTQTESSEYAEPFENTYQEYGSEEELLPIRPVVHQCIPRV